MYKNRFGNFALEKYTDEYVEMTAEELDWFEKYGAVGFKIVDNDFVINSNIEAEQAEAAKAARIEEIKAEMAAIDLKRIRATLEPSVKDEETGETWLEYYNAQIFDLRDELNSLEI